MEGFDGPGCKWPQGALGCVLRGSSYRSMKLIFNNAFFDLDNPVQRCDVMKMSQVHCQCGNERETYMHTKRYNTRRSPRGPFLVHIQLPRPPSHSAWDEFVFVFVQTCPITSLKFISVVVVNILFGSRCTPGARVARMIHRSAHAHLIHVAAAPGPCVE